MSSLFLFPQGRKIMLLCCKPPENPGMLYALGGDHLEVVYKKALFCKNARFAKMHVLHRFG